jgi:predicted anti-sigma-YlaC factor YlaD
MTDVDIRLVVRLALVGAGSALLGLGTSWEIGVSVALLFIALMSAISE